MQIILITLGFAHDGVPTFLAAQALADLRKYHIHCIFQDSLPNRAELFKAGLR